jgi:hypothetical protein
MFIGFGLLLDDHVLESRLFDSDGIVQYFNPQWDVELIQKPYFLGIVLENSEIKSFSLTVDSEDGLEDSIREFNAFRSNCSDFGVKIPEGQLIVVV